MSPSHSQIVFLAAISKPTPSSASSAREHFLPPLRPISANDSSLCTFCRGFSISSLFAPSHPCKPKPHDLLSCVLSRSTSCALCRLIGHAIHSVVCVNRKRPIPTLHESSSLKVEDLFTVGSGDSVLRCFLAPDPILSSNLWPLPTFRVLVSFRPERDLNEIYRVTDPDAKNLKATIQLIRPSLPTLVSPESTSPPDTEHHGSIVRPTLDIPLLKRWLQVCSTHDHITPKWSEPDTPFQILLIDVHQRCLIHAGAEENYVALSYTWGGDQKIKLLRANLKQWKKPGGMPEYSEFPKTLGDAMALVRAMGEPYLWIDALCIVQDDEGPDRDAQLKQMNKVYEFARFTLIAAAGSNADAGLPGVNEDRPRSHQMVETIERLSLTVPLPPLLDAIDITQWRTRGWTYQEQLLSPRSLIFMPYQVYYQCDGQVFQEDFRSPSEVDGRARHNSWYSNERLSTPMERILYTDPRTLELSTKEGSPAALFERYKSVINVYTRRDLGRKSDVIAAFSGISAALQCFPASMGYVAGLSVGGFANSLLWTPKQPLTRRYDKIGGKEVNVFPTWSWAGWVGPVSIENVSDLDAPQVLEWWITYGAKGKEEKIKLPIVDLKTQNYSQRPKEGPFSQRRNGAWEVSQAHTLEFRTTVATFYVSVNEGQNTSYLFPIYNSKDEWVGTLSLTSVDAQNSLQSNETTLKTKAPRLFLLISKRSSSAAIFSDPAILPLGKEFALNVMMVDRLASGKMERLGHGVIHVNAWWGAYPVEEEVTMI